MQPMKKDTKRTSITRYSTVLYRNKQGTCTASSGSKAAVFTALFFEGLHPPIPLKGKS